ncbi:MAG: hypothetical protein R3C70_10545 [Geminicoccaceae bacterium]
MIVQQTRQQNEVQQRMQRVANEVQLMAIRLRCMDIPHIGLQIDTHDLARELETLAIDMEAAGRLPVPTRISQLGFSAGFG